MADGRRTGHVRYTERAFQQDAERAMRGDVVRALVELITNADDAYGDREGRIVVEVNRPSSRGEWSRISVRDAARGLDADGLESSFAQLGARTSGFEAGRDVRGNLGRGAKDTAAFGRTTFEAVQAGSFARLTLTEEGVWDLEHDRPADTADRFRLELGPSENGLTAAMDIAPRFSVPKFARLLDRLSRNAQLRLLTASRTVLLREGPTERPILYEEPEADLVLDEAIAITGYEGCEAHLRLYRLHTRADGTVDDESPHGLLIRGTKAVYENTFFDLNARPQAAWFRGTVQCARIEELIRQYDDYRDQGKPPPDSNPQRLLDRDRDGLNRNHPFTRALIQILTRHVAVQFDALAREQEESRREGSELRRAFDQLSSTLARQLRADLEELDEDAAAGDGRDELKHLQLVPPRLVIAPGGRHTITIIVKDDLPVSPGEPRVRSDDPRVIELISEPVALMPHPHIVAARITRVRIEAIAEGRAGVVALVGSEAARCEVEVIEREAPDPELVEDLRFARPAVAATLGRPRSVELQAPESLVSQYGVAVGIEVEGAGLELTADGIQLHFAPAQGYFLARVPFRGTAVGSSARLVATLGTHQAMCAVRVVEPGNLAALGLHIEMKDEQALTQRASVELSAEGVLVRIYGRHRALRGLLGDHNGEKFEREDSPERAALAEVISDELANYLTEKEGLRHPERFSDVAEMIVKRRRRQTDYLVPCQRLLLRRD